MSKIDESKLLDELRHLNQRFSQMSNISLNLKNMSDAGYEETANLIQDVIHQKSSSNAPTPEPKAIATWIPAKGQKGPFEMLKDKDAALYRELKSDLDYADHPLSKTIDGKLYSVWLMQDNETIGRRLKQ